MELPRWPWLLCSTWSFRDAGVFPPLDFPAPLISSAGRGLGCRDCSILLSGAGGNQPACSAAHVPATNQFLPRSVDKHLVTRGYLIAGSVSLMTEERGNQFGPSSSNLHSSSHGVVLYVITMNRSLCRQYVGRQRTGKAFGFLPLLKSGGATEVTI